MGLNRRNFIKATGAAALTSLAGCAGNENNDQPDTDNNTPPPVDHETRIEFLESHHINTLPIVNQENLNDKAGIRLEVEDQNGLENVKLSYNDQHREEPLTLYDKTKDEFKHDVNGKMVPISEEFPQRLLAPETGEFTVDVTDVNGNTETRTEQIQTQTREWKIDRGNGEYQTERKWDDLRFNRQQLYENHVSKWHEEAVYDTVLRELEEVNKEKYNAAAAQATYSNNKYDLGLVDGPGYWDPEVYEQLTQLEYILGDAQNTILTHQRGTHDTAFSDWNNRFAATLEDIVHKFNKELREYQEETGEKAVHAGYVNEGGHGTVITYTDLENTDIEAEHPWQFVDTTTDKSAPVTEKINTGGGYNSFVEGYEPEEYTELGYNTKKRKAMQGVRSFIIDNDYTDGLESSMWGINDSVLENIFNEHIPSGGSIDPILDMIEKTVDLQIDTGKNVQVYGEDLENYQVAVADDQELYEMSMDPETQVTEKEVENYLLDLPA